MLDSQDVDCVKVYNNVPEESLIAICEEAHSAGLLVLGYVPRSVSMTRAVAIGMDCLEHIRITGRELLSQEEADKVDYLPLGVRETLLWEQFDLESEGMQNVIQMLADTKVFLDPTLIVDADMFAGGVEDGRASETEAMLPEPTLEALRKDRHLDPLRAPDDLQEKSLAGFEKRLQFIDQCNAAGVRILTGTDTFGPGALLPGASLHNELVLLQRAGLSPLEVLRAATETAASALRREKDRGALEAGKVADIVVLDADPLADARNLRSIRMIVKDGREYTPPSLIHLAGNGYA